MPVNRARARLVPRRSPGAKWQRRSSSGLPSAAGEQRVYLDTPTWMGHHSRTIWSALAGGKRVVHVEYVPSPDYAVRQIRLRPEEYRRLWSSIRAEFANGAAAAYSSQRLRLLRRLLSRRRQGERDQHLQQPGSRTDFRLAGIKTSVRPPFTPGLSGATGRPLRDVTAEVRIAGNAISCFSTKLASTTSLSPRRSSASKLTSSSSFSITVWSRRAPIFSTASLTSAAMRASASMPSSANSIVTPSVPSSARYCSVRLARVDDRMRTKSSCVSAFSSTRIGRRPCSSGSRSGGLRDVETRRWR